jgi:hypothetical protein
LQQTFSGWRKPAGGSGILSPAGENPPEAPAHFLRLEKTRRRLRHTFSGWRKLAGGSGTLSPAGENPPEAPADFLRLRISRRRLRQTFRGCGFHAKGSGRLPLCGATLPQVAGRAGGHFGIIFASPGLPSGRKPDEAVPSGFGADSGQNRNGFRTFSSQHIIPRKVSQRFKKKNEPILLPTFFFFPAKRHPAFFYIFAGRLALIAK